MIQKSDIQMLQDLPIEQVAEAVGMTVKRHTTLCPWHSDTVPSLTFNRAKNRYRCYVCDAHGRVIDLVMHMMNLSFCDACHWLAQTFGLTLHTDRPRYFQHIVPRKIQPVPKEPAAQPVDTRYLSQLVCQPHLSERALQFLFHERKISPTVVRWLGISSIECPVPMSGNPRDAWFNAPSLLFPYKDQNGQVLSVQARYLGKENKPRFQFPKGSQCHVYNLPILKLLKPGESLFITEGVSDCMAMLSAGRKAIAIPSATLLKEEDLQPLEDLSRRLGTPVPLHMFPDDDAPGQSLFLKLREHFPDINHHAVPPGYKDYGEYWSDFSNVNCKL